MSMTGICEPAPSKGIVQIMRRILRKIAANDLDSLGDTSTLADPAVVEDLIRNRVQT